MRYLGHLPIARLTTLITQTADAILNPGGVANVALSGRGQAITPTVVQFIQNTMKTNHVPGLAISVVHTNSPSEFGAWGNKTEDGEQMTTDVCPSLFKS